MRLSLLQKYILRSVYENRLKRFPRDSFVEFYRSRNPLKLPLVKGETVVNSVTKSIERMIDKELMVGYGVRTPHKWYIQEVRLMPKGRRIARSLRGEQMKLPLISRKSPPKADPPRAEKVKSQKYGVPQSGT